MCFYYFKFNFITNVSYQVCLDYVVPVMQLHSVVTSEPNILYVAFCFYLTTAYLGKISTYSQAKS